MSNVAAAGADGLRHVALRCPGAGEMTESVLRFARDGVQAGEAVLIASAGPVLHRLRLQLGSYGGQVSWTGMPSSGTNPSRIIAAIRAFADEHPSQHIRCVQEPAWHLLRPAHRREAIRQEALVNLALAGTRAVVLCAFDSQLGGTDVASMQRTHPLLARDGRWEPSASFAADPAVPPECDEPLPLPPAPAAALTYRADQARVREFTAEQARRAGLPDERITDLVIAVGELAGNTLAHTSGPGTLWVWAADGELLCQVSDSGHITDPLAGSFLPGLATPGGGRGLWVMHQLCDLAEVRTGPAGTTIRIHMRLPAVPAGHEPVSGCSHR